MKRGRRSVVWFTAGLLVSAYACRSQEVDPNSRPGFAIDSTTELVLGESEGPAALGAVIRVDADEQGRFWIFSEQYMPSVFGADGHFIAAVGRPGEGPGEMTSPYQLWNLPGDSVAVLDGVSLHVYSGLFQYVRTVRLPAPDARDALILSWPDSVLLNATRPSRPAFGQPLHLVDFSGVAVIRRSFGTADSEITRYNADRRPQRALAMASDGGYWSADRDRYHIEKWSRSHVREREISFAPEWFRDRSDLDTGTPDRPPSPVNIGVREDSTGRLWSYFLVASPDYGRAWDRVRGQFQTSGFQEIGSTDVDWSQLYDTQVEVIDPGRTEILASLRVRGMAVADLPDRRVALLSEAADGTPRIRILHLTLQASDEREGGTDRAHVRYQPLSAESPLVMLVQPGHTSNIPGTTSRTRSFVSECTRRQELVPTTVGDRLAATFVDALVRMPSRCIFVPRGAAE